MRHHLLAHHAHSEDRDSVWVLAAAAIALIGTGFVLALLLVESLGNL
ncbi:hypothetical protein [Nocardioides sp. R-C-SC26]|nr:hypothetical protein [Nocardioides sp. R-C-SC26]